MPRGTLAWPDYSEPGVMVHTCNSSTGKLRPRTASILRATWATKWDPASKSNKNQNKTPLTNLMWRNNSIQDQWNHSSKAVIHFCVISHSRGTAVTQQHCSTHLQADAQSWSSSPVYPGGQWESSLTTEKQHLGNSGHKLPPSGCNQCQPKMQREAC